MSGERAALLVLLFTAIGASAKIAGFAVSGSLALYVDGLTCIASIVSAALFYRLVLEAEKPADKDHPYGHARMLVASSHVTMIVYSFTAGVAVATLASWGPSSRVEPIGVVYAVAGLAAYTMAVLYARRAKIAGKTLSYFTASEIVESIVSLVSVVIGAYASPVYDYAGSLALAGYLLYGLYRETASLTPLITDQVPPALLEEIKREIEREGLKIGSLRLRPCPEGGYHGDAVILLPPAITVEKAHRIVDRIEEKIKKKYRAVLVVHVEPEEPSRGKSQQA